MYKLLFIAVLVFVSCKSKTGSALQVEEGSKQPIVKRNGYTYTAEAFENDSQESKNSGECSFKVSLSLEKSFLENQPTLTKELQFGVDSAFYAVATKDTLYPLYVLPVANGQPLQPQYIVAFNRQPFENITLIELQTNLSELGATNSPGLQIEISKNQ